MKLRAFLYAAAGLMWIAVPLVALAAGLVPCGANGDAAATCNLCTFGQLIQNIINFAIGLSIPLAAVLFSYAGWLYFSNRENSSKIEQAHRIFTSVLVGFAIAIAGWLIVQTILKTLAPGYQSWTTFSCSAERQMNTNIGQLLQQSGIGQVSTAPPVGVSTAYLNQPGGPQLIAPQGGGCDAYLGTCWDAQNNVVDPKSGSIANAATLYYGQDTSAGPDGGNLACAWAVNNILQSAGVAPIGDGVSVASMQQALDNGRGTQVSTPDAQPGDIIVWKTDTVSHVGICQDAGCNRALSNSSNNASFTNISGSTFLGVQGQVYRVNK